MQPWRTEGPASSLEPGPEIFVVIVLEFEVLRVADACCSLRSDAVSASVSVSVSSTGVDTVVARGVTRLDFHLTPLDHQHQHQHPKHHSLLLPT